jgi:hypothetical protein
VAPTWSVERLEKEDHFRYSRVALVSRFDGARPAEARQSRIGVPPAIHRQRVPAEVAEMQTFSFVTPNMGLAENPKSTSGETWPEDGQPRTKRGDLTRTADYVFVDEHNRHKRLKGTRAFAFDASDVRLMIG